MINYKSHKNLILVLIGILILVIFLLSMHITLFNDEAFSLGLIKFNSPKLIYYDSLDVHPPLYYFLLKLFLGITTFYSNNFYLKIIFARLFSCILSALTFIILYKINYIFNIKIKCYKQIIIFLLLGFLPFIFLPESNFFIIRMYPLAALLITGQFYEILKYRYINNNFLNLFMIFLLAVLSYYTHYVSAIISGLMIFNMFIYYLMNNRRKSLYFFFIGIISIISYFPWLFIAINQMFQVSSGHWWMSDKYFLINMVLIFFLLLLFTYPFVRYQNLLTNRCKFGIEFLLITFIMLLIIVTIISLFKHPMFQSKYAYPILLLYTFLNLSVLYKYSDIYKLNSLIIVMLILFGNIYGCISQIRNYDLPEINTIKDIHEMHHYNNVYVRFNAKPTQYITDVIYCKYNNKYVKNYKNIKLLPKNKKLFTLYKNVFLVNKNKY